MSALPYVILADVLTPSNFWYYETDTLAIPTKKFKDLAKGGHMSQQQHNYHFNETGKKYLVIANLAGAKGGAIIFDTAALISAYGDATTGMQIILSDSISGTTVQHYSPPNSDGTPHPNNDTIGDPSDPGNLYLQLPVFSTIANTANIFGLQYQSTTSPAVFAAGVGVPNSHGQSPLAIVTPPAGVVVHQQPTGGIGWWYTLLVFALIVLIVIIFAVGYAIYKARSRTI